MEEDHDDHLLTPPSPTTSFSQLLFGHDDDHHVGPSLFSSIATSSNSPKMLSFEGYHPNNQPNNVNVVHVTPQKSVITSSESSSASSSANLNNTNNNNKKRSGSDSAVTVAGGGGRRYSKKAKSENTASTGHAKRKERLGERISALQQLVSPFGKTDTASVLHEAMGYIRFLHDQVQVLCSPYLQAFPTSSPRSGSYNTGDGEEEAKGGLSSRGLCLIPVESTLHVASTNGADFWSPAMTNHHHSSSTRH